MIANLYIIGLALALIGTGLVVAGELHAASNMNLMAGLHFLAAGIGVFYNFVQRQIDIEKADADEILGQGCEVPPPGWWCSREPGHDGPCAARPIRTPR